MFWHLVPPGSGTEFGDLVGLLDGFDDGRCEGSDEGKAVGTKLGIDDGPVLGDSVGA